MRTLAVVAGLAGCSGASSAQERGRVLYAYCAACHMADGAGSRDLAAPAIAGLDAWYVDLQLEKFRSGARGAHPDDAAGLRMRAMSRTIEATADLRAVAAYVAAMPPVPASEGAGRAAAPARGPHASGLGEAAPGDAERGQALWASCAACHGADGRGNQALGAPPLAGLDAWYLADQLAKFRSGLRGANPQDAGGVQMRPMAMGLPDARAVRDVAAYAASLGDR